MTRLGYWCRHAMLRLRYRLHGIPYGHTPLTDPTNAGGYVLPDEVTE